MLNDVPFSITDSRYDTSRAAESRQSEIFIEPPIRHPIAAHLLINAGGAQSSLAGTTLGQIKFRFIDETSLTEQFVLGKNIREWAIGNASPGLLVTAVAPDSDTRIAWAGRNLSGNDAILDCLTIPFPSTKLNAPLRQIDLVRDVGPGTAHKNLGFFVSAITIEHA